MFTVIKISCKHYTTGPKGIHFNYKDFSILPDIMDEYIDMVKYLANHYYSGMTRYTTNAFLRIKLGGVLQKCDVAPHIYKSSEEASRALKR